MPDKPGEHTFDRVALRFQPNNTRADHARDVLLPYFRRKNIEVDILHADPEPCHIHPHKPEDLEILDRIDFMVSLGGDGTFLSTSRLASCRDIPVFGVHLGNLGFLTEVTLNNALKALDRVLKGDYKIEERLMIETELDHNDTRETYVALNDIVFHRFSLHRMVSIAVFIDNHPVVSYEADGLIVSTPTGSTAYSLSSGGSILWPDLDALIITPISPHTLSSRPLIVPSDKVIEVRCPKAHKSAISVMLDGQLSCNYKYSTSFQVKRSATKAKLIRLGERRFGDILREKLNWDKRFK